MRATLFFLCGFFFIHANSYCQTPEQLDSQVVVLFGQGEYEKALPLAEKAVELINQDGGEKHPEYLTAINNLGILYKKVGDYIKAKPYYKLVADNQKQQYGEMSEEYANSLNKLAILYETMEQNDTAINLYKEAISIYEHSNKNAESYPVLIRNLASLFEKIQSYHDAESLYTQLADIAKNLNGENTDYASQLIDLAYLYERMGQYGKAESLYVHISEIYKRSAGDTSLAYAKSLNFLGGVYYRTSQYSKAEETFIAVARIRKQSAGENSELYGSSLNNLALVYNDMGQYTKAEPLFLEALEIDKNTAGKKSEVYSTALNNLALLYANMGEYNKAITLYLQSKEIKKTLYGEQSDWYAQSLNNLASVYDHAGDYSKSESMYLQALAIKKKLYGEQNDDYANTLNGLGLLYEYMGLYTKAELYLVKASEIRKEVFGEHSADYASSLHNVAGLFIKLGYYSEAEKLYLKSLEIKKEVYGENHFSYATSLTGLAIVYKIRNEYDKAEPLYKKAVEIKKQQLGEEHPEYATALNNLAVFYDAKGDYSHAIDLYEQVFAIYKKQLGEQHSYIADLIGNFEMSYQKLGDFARAEPLMIQSNELHLQILYSTLPILSEQEKETFLNERAYSFEISNSLLYTNRGSSGSLKKSSLNIQLLFKSLSLSDSKNMLAAIRSSKDTALKNLFDQWQGYKMVLARQYSLPKNARIAGIDSLEKNADAIEKQLSRRSDAFRKQQNTVHTTMEDIQHFLASDEADIEFVRFRLFNKVWTDSIIYAAYIFRKNDSIPQFVPLFEEKQIQQIFDSAGKTATSMVYSFYRGIGVKNRGAATLGPKLYKLVWQELEPYLENIKKISYSPAGKLYGIAFHALPVDSSTVLMDKYQLKQYTSTRQVALRTADNQATKPGSITLFGDANFSMDSLQLTKKRSNQSNTDVSTSVYILSTRGAANSSWPNLSGTAEEVKAIKQLFDENKITTKSFIQTAASEENLKALNGNSPQILHIATHGFFLPEPDKKKKEINHGNTYTLADDPLLRSGLILAGGNYAWSGKTPVEGVEDGIATAYEISQLDLSNTELVVLSACETALGDVKGSEGVFGLQRAFKMAGIKKLIVSLWQVPDKETAELMTTFYTYWMNGKNINESFNQAQADMRKKYSPFYWAAFVLVE